MNINLTVTEYRRHNDGTLSHTFVRVSGGEGIGSCPATEDLGAWITSKLAEYPGPGKGWNSYKIASRKMVTLGG